MTTLANGSLSLYDPNNPLDFGNLSLINYELTASSPVTTVGTNLMSHSGLKAGSLNNMGWLVPENGSELQVGNLTGSGDITAIDGTVVIAGSAPSSETIGLVDNSQLYLGQPSLAATIDMDSTSEIHIYNQATVNGVVSSLTANGSPYESLPFHGLFNIHSLTPGYAPEAEFVFGGPNDQVIGVTIMDKPTPSTTSATDTIVGWNVINPTGSISATDGSVVSFNTASAPSSDTILLDSTSYLSITPPLGMNFLASIDMVAGSEVDLSAIQGGLTSITEYPQLNLVDFYSGSTLEAQLHIHNESSGSTIWATQAGRGALITLSDSVSQPTVNFGPGTIPSTLIPIHVI